MVTRGPAHYDANETELTAVSIGHVKSIYSEDIPNLNHFHSQKPSMDTISNSNHRRPTSVQNSDDDDEDNEATKETDSLLSVTDEDHRSRKSSTDNKAPHYLAAVMKSITKSVSDSNLMSKVIARSSPSRSSNRSMNRPQSLLQKEDGESKGATFYVHTPSDRSPNHSITSRHSRLMESDNDIDDNTTETHLLIIPANLVQQLNTIDEEDDTKAPKIKDNTASIDEFNMSYFNSVNPIKD